MELERAHIYLNWMDLVLKIYWFKSISEDPKDDELYLIPAKRFE